MKVMPQVVEEGLRRYQLFIAAAADQTHPVRIAGEETISVAFRLVLSPVCHILNLLVSDKMTAAVLHFSPGGLAPGNHFRHI